MSNTQPKQEQSHQLTVQIDAKILAALEAKAETYRVQQQDVTVEKVASWVLSSWAGRVEDPIRRTDPASPSAPRD